MRNQHKFGKNKEYDIRDVRMETSTYNTRYGYIQQGQSIIMLSNEELVEYQHIVQQQVGDKKIDPHTKYHIKPKMPTNITQAEQRHKQKMEKARQGKPRTEISVDQVPSLIHDGTFEQCFNCIDKNEEIIHLRNYNKKFPDGYFKIKQQRDSLQELANKNAKQIEQLLNQNAELHKRVLNIQKQSSNLRKAQEQNNKEKKTPQVEYLQHMMQRHKELYANIVKLQSENHVLRSSNISKDNQIKSLRQSIIQNSNPQNTNFNKNNSESCIMDLSNQQEQVIYYEL